MAFQQYVERFRPNFVVIGVCPNDFGDIGAVLKRGEGNWNEARYRLDAIHYRCRLADARCILVPIPWIDQMRTPRDSANYPGALERAGNFMSVDYCDPIEDFVEASLRLSRKADRSGSPYPWNPLYNGRIQDHHLSPIGADVWGKTVARRIALLVEPVLDKKTP